MVVVAAQTHPLAGLSSVLPASLNGVEFVGFDDDLPIQQHGRSASSKSMACTVKMALHFDNLQMIKEAVMHRVGVSIMPVRVIQNRTGARPAGRDFADRAAIVPAAGDHPPQEKAL